MTTSPACLTKGVDQADMRIFSSAENFQRVALRMSRMVLSALPGRRSFLLVVVSSCIKVAPTQ